MPFHLTYQSASLTDLEILNRILKDSKGYWGYDDFFMTTFMKHLSITPNTFVNTSFTVAKIDRIFQNANNLDKPDVVGFYGLSKEDHRLELSHFYVASPFIRQGIGRHLWQHAIDKARKLNEPSLWIWSDPKADGFYKKMGAKVSFLDKSSLKTDRYQTVFMMDL